MAEALSHRPVTVYARVRSHASSCEIFGWQSGIELGYYYYFFKTAIGLTPGGSSTSHVYTQTEYRERNIHNNRKKFGKCGPCPVFASYTLIFAFQPRKRHWQTSVRVAKKFPDIPVAVVLTFPLSAPLHQSTILTLHLYFAFIRRKKGWSLWSLQRAVRAVLDRKTLSLGF
jgi:hypothetical protein